MFGGKLIAFIHNNVAKKNYDWGNQRKHDDQIKKTIHKNPHSEKSFVESISRLLAIAQSYPYQASSFILFLLFALSVKIAPLKFDFCDDSL